MTVRTRNALRFILGARRDGWGFVQPLALMMAVAWMSMSTAPAMADGESGAAAQRSGARYPVSEFTTRMTLPIQLNEPIEQASITLARTPRGYDAVAQGLEGSDESLSARRHDPPQMYTAEALRSLLEQIRQQMNRQLAELGATFDCVQVSVDPSEIDPVTGRDRRPPGEAAMTLDIIVDGPRYFIGRFVPTYRYEQLGGLPAVSELMDTPIELAEISGAIAAPRPGARMVRRSLAEWSMGGPKSYHASALVVISNALVQAMNERHIVAVYVAPDPEEIEFGGVNLTDLRRGTTDLELIILTAVVQEIRTVASGERIKDDEERIDNWKHQSIRTGSPVQPAADGEPTTGLLRKDELDAYVFRLNRHPGRRVDMALSAGEGVGGVILDYLVAENKPLFLYAQISNTGTKQTDIVRERFGLVHTQLTNNDDILSLEYITTSFDDDSNAVVGSYEAPFLADWPKWRWRIAASYSDYAASEVGFASENFGGESYSYSGELIYNFYQDRELFLDLNFGIRYDHQDVSNTSFGFPIDGKQDFFLPHVGMLMERVTQVDSLLGSVQLEWSMPGVTGVDRDQIDNLGRLDPSDNWLVLQWDFGYTTFLEPLINPAAWADTTTPDSSTLAHEIAVSFRGQWSVNDDRLIPQVEHVVGGLYSVRGYPESIVAGDTALIGSIEYRYHVPRAFKIREPTTLFNRPFRYAPQYVYGRPDWDLILKGFFDIGHTIISHPFNFEDDETLIGAGVGMDLQFRQNFNVRLDWGFTLNGLNTTDVNAGSNRLNVVATIIY